MVGLWKGAGITSLSHRCRHFTEVLRSRGVAELDLVSRKLCLETKAIDFYALLLLNSPIIYAIIQLAHWPFVFLGIYAALTSVSLPVFHIDPPSMGCTLSYWAGLLGSPTFGGDTGLLPALGTTPVQATV